MSVSSGVSMILVGKDRFLKKDKSGYWHKIYYISEFDNEKREAGAIGSDTGDVFVSEECWHSIKEEHIGQAFTFIYATNRFKRAEVVGLKFIEEIEENE